MAVLKTDYSKQAVNCSIPLFKDTYIVYSTNGPDELTLQQDTLPKEYSEFLSKCISIVEANIENENFTLKQFSLAMGLSYSGLYKKIKSTCGQSVNAFIRSARLQRAATIMLTEDITIIQAGLQVGIEDQRYFRQQFVKMFGVTPSAYIKMYRFSQNKNINIT